jgi:ectoine hydroxylase-related dioxygenase (phytanoyl-CoA dioxygenase family)
LNHTDAVSQRLEVEGFAVVADVIDGVRCDILASHLQGVGKSRAGSRALLMQPWCQKLASNLRENALLGGALPLNAVAVQCTAFDKSPTKNWLVSLHQDLSIPVKNRVESEECAGWSEKEGQFYVQPPVRVLEHLVAVRVHIDECPAESGALRVVPGSHCFGRLDAGKVDELRTERGETVVPVARGGVLLMRPLLLHASSKATEPKARRVLHFVFGPRRLPLGLEWQWAV